MVSEEKNSCILIQKWIFEHACKYGMFKVLSCFYKDENWGSNGCFQNTTSKSHQYMLFVAYLKCILSCSQYKSKEIFEKDDVLKSLIKNIPLFFKKQKFIATSKCFKLMKWIKTLDLIVSLKRGQDIISGQVKNYFPNSVENSLKNDFNIEEYEKIDKLNEDYKFLRQYMYTICMTPKTLKKYLDDKFDHEFKYIVSKILKLLQEVIDKITSNFTRSPIDQLKEAAEEFNGCGDAAIELFLERYKSNMNEDELIELLQLFYPENNTLNLLEDQIYQSVPETQTQALVNGNEMPENPLVREMDKFLTQSIECSESSVLSFDDAIDSEPVRYVKPLQSSTPSTNSIGHFNLDRATKNYFKSDANKTKLKAQHSVLSDKNLQPEKNGKEFYDLDILDSTKVKGSDARNNQNLPMQKVSELNSKDDKTTQSQTSLKNFKIKDDAKADGNDVTVNLKSCYIILNNEMNSKHRNGDNGNSFDYSYNCDQSKRCYQNKRKPYHRTSVENKDKYFRLNSNLLNRCQKLSVCLERLDLNSVDLLNHNMNESLTNNLPKSDFSKQPFSSKQNHSVNYYKRNSHISKNFFDVSVLPCCILLRKDFIFRENDSSFYIYS